MRLLYAYLVSCCPIGSTIRLGAVRGMMFGFGDSLTPSQASLLLMEEMVIEYIVALVTKVCWAVFVLWLCCCRRRLLFQSVGGRGEVGGQCEGPGILRFLVSQTGPDSVPLLLRFAVNAARRWSALF